MVNFARRKRFSHQYFLFLCVLVGCLLIIINYHSKSSIPQTSIPTQPPAQQKIQELVVGYVKENKKKILLVKQINGKIKLKSSYV